MAKTLTNEIPLKILTVKEYLHNKNIKTYSPFSKGTYRVGDHRYTPEELELAYPTTYVKVVPRIHDHLPNRQK